MNLSPEKGPFFSGDVSAQMEETLKTVFFTECQHITHLNTAVIFAFFVPPLVLNTHLETLIELAGSLPYIQQNVSHCLRATKVVLH